LAYSLQLKAYGFLPETCNLKPETALKNPKSRTINEQTHKKNNSFFFKEQAVYIPRHPHIDNMGRIGF
jgi:hypothetical protein